MSVVTGITNKVSRDMFFDEARRIDQAIYRIGYDAAESPDWSSSPEAAARIQKAYDALALAAAKFKEAARQ